MNKLILFLLLFPVIVFSQTPSKQLAKERVKSFLTTFNESFPVRGTVKIDSILFSSSKKEISIYFNPVLAYIPFREELVETLESEIQNSLGKSFDNYKISLFANGIPFKELIPNFYRIKAADFDQQRVFKEEETRPKTLIRNQSKVWQPTQGLQDKHIALWHSHGWYYENSLDRWEWQRARLYQTVEDVFPMAFVLPYIAPMLENAGANVLLPRERDWQTLEVIVDNDQKNGDYKETVAKKVVWENVQTKGFGVGSPPYEIGTNPFQLGTTRQVKVSSEEAKAVWQPEFAEKGEYGVYIAYSSLENSVEDARYTVYHLGGKTEFEINQKIGGGTWIFLGRFLFDKGKNETGKVELSNQSDSKNGVITADAVRFGGGMSNIVRNGKLSDRPRFLEAAKYYMQFAGMPDSMVYHLNEDSDYKDDYQSRAEWANYLRGAPFGPSNFREAKGLGIPIDASISFHTDAGTIGGDSTIGTLMIHNTAADEGVFPNGTSRYANRDYADIVQTQIVEDIWAKYDSTWARRGLWDKGYSEAFRPTFPSILLELLSHSNFQDMRFGQDPRFRFDISRAIYKGTLKFLANQAQEEYVIQPLPVTHFQAQFAGEKTVKLEWKPTVDPLESTAKAEKYIVYTRIDDGGFDNGTLVNQPSFTYSSLKPNAVYSFKVTAVNAGGESFPSEVLSVGWNGTSSKPILIVNAFDRVAAPAQIKTAQFAGFANFIDEGVADRFNLHFTGEQYDFNPNSPWLDDDAPGHGASYADYEGKIIMGNTFDFPYVHGKAIQANGQSFVSVSDETVMEGSVNLNDYDLVDFILGEEKKTVYPKDQSMAFEVFPKSLQEKIRQYTQQGGNLFLSGAYIGTDLVEGKPKKHSDIMFAKEVLQFQWRTNHASKKGKLIPETQFKQIETEIIFNTVYNPKIYKVEAPDAIEPVNEKGKVIFRYQNQKSAGVAFKDKYSVITLGFPFETVLVEAARNELMKAVLEFMGE